MGDADPSKPPSYSWALIQRIQLAGQRGRDASNMRGSFAACFSESGKYLAVATQYGAISIFDATLLAEDGINPVLALFHSSRPSSVEGAVRAMEFSPGPFELLAWTEACGRVGLADARNGFVSQGLLVLDPNADGAEGVSLISRVSDYALGPRLRSSRTELSGSGTPDDPGLVEERRQLQALTLEMIDRQQAPLTDDETQVLQAHRAARRQRDALRESSIWSGIEGLGQPSNAARDDGDASLSGIPPTARPSIPPQIRNVNENTQRDIAFLAYIDRHNRGRDRRIPQAPPEPYSPPTAGIPATITAERRAALDGDFSLMGLRNEAGSSSTSTQLERLSLTTSGIPAQPPRLPLFGLRSSEVAGGSLVDGGTLVDGVWLHDLLGEPEVGSTSPPAERRRLPRIELDDTARQERERTFAHRLRQPWGRVDSDDGAIEMPPRQQAQLTDRRAIELRELLRERAEAVIPRTAASRPSGLDVDSLLASTLPTGTGAAGSSALTAGLQQIRRREPEHVRTTGICWSPDGRIL